MSNQPYACLIVQHTATKSKNLRLADNYRIIANPDKVSTVIEATLKDMKNKYPGKHILMQHDAIAHSFTGEEPEDKKEQEIYEFIKQLDQIKPRKYGTTGSMLINIVVQEPDTRNAITQVTAFAIPLEK